MRKYVIRGGLAAAAVAAVGLVAPASGAGAVATATTYKFTDIVNPADKTFNQELGINDQQVIVGYYGNGTTNPNVGYNLVPPYGSANFTTENYPGAVQTQVVAINDLAQTAGFYVDGTGKNVGWVKVNGMFTPVSNPAGPTFNQLLGLNNNGVAAGFYNDAGGVAHGYTYNVATKAFTPITPNGATNSTVTGINDQGVVTGFYTDSDGDVASFVDVNGTFTSFEVFGSTSTQAFGINDTGTVVGSWVGPGGASHGFVWRAGKATTVNDPKGALTTIINGINNGGSIVGFYTLGGNTIGFVGVPSITQP